MNRPADCQRLEGRTLLSVVPPDPTFGAGGVVRTPFLGPGIDSAAAVMVLGDGRVLAAGRIAPSAQS